MHIIEYIRDDIKKTQQQQQQHFQRFGHPESVEHDEKQQPKFGGNRFMGTRDMAA